MDRKLAQVVCFVFGALMFALFFSDHQIAHRVNLNVLVEYIQIIFAFALIVGVVALVKNNVRQVSTGQDRPYRLVMLAGLVSMPILALVWGMKAGTPFQWMFENVQAPMQSTVFALLAFFVASASYRGFRARSIPAGILLVAALVILLGRSLVIGPLADVLPDVAEWIRNYPSMAARRAILIGIGLGSLTTSLRVIVGIERTWLGGDK
ncbi:MAG: hypothetical protein OEV49_13395 [candidate division Zixibacteria bacterium]|nr:hypothetical protein [candidate division Zixibacteria bacterium]MDH3938344.1 hypothetical protein [candidate division Zixibacteria bacterium]MDH4034527.1 hypothetical protein [candidate division Zixibacteria bacterium]